ncbi:thiol-disulfide oxidoreductase DCC family protein [Microbulbifer guangxiensis]|uniref:thiol-disulfide oxidoreductase DCC family protein n=1 Tax=Microbulbifer guangxiensis TaxID=2904249 RepID=UPI001F27D69C|nr:DCC1-like thiol-disulfide oxidoreductase family protein [Microbulbifer guangxiensis]
MPRSLPDRIILFDSLCNLCNGWVRLVLRHDHRALFTLCRVQSAAGQQLLEELGRPRDTFDTVLYLERDDTGRQRVYERSTAALRVLGQLPAPWKALAILRLVPSAIRDWIYDRVAQNRYRLFGRSEQCRLPGAEEKPRFLEELEENEAD